MRSASLIVKYLIENDRKRLNIGYDEDLLNSLKKELSNLGMLEEADKRIEEAVKHDKEFKLACEACDKLKEILKDFSIWKVGKFNEELKGIKENLCKYDKHYVARIFLYKELMELPKFAKLERDEQIEIAMQLGALDFQGLAGGRNDS